VARNASPKLSAIDLNLLVVFDAIMRERSVTKAGRRLNLSQPAMSHALARLRHTLKDDLFVRAPTGMVPTPHAEKLATPVRFALEGLQQALEPEQFDPTTAKATFRIAVDNYAAVVMVSKIVHAAAEIAPKVRLDFRPSGTLDVTDQIDRSELQLAIGSTEIAGERFSQRSLAQDDFVVVLRKGHAASRLKEIPADKLASLPLLEVSSARFGGADGGDGPRVGKREPDLRAPFLSAADIVQNSDFVTILPRAVAQTLIKSHQLCLRPMARAPKPIQSSMIWLRRLDNQGAHAWLRDIIARAVRHS
jgi:DNA-binding transcriptional LysR family regulator